MLTSRYIKAAFADIFIHIKCKKLRENAQSKHNTQKLFIYQKAKPRR